MDYSFVAGKAIDSLRGSIGRVVVDNNQIEFEVRFLFQDRVDGIGNGAYTVPYGNDYRSLVFEIVGVEFDLFEYRFEITALISIFCVKVDESSVCFCTFVISWG